MQAAGDNFNHNLLKASEAKQIYFQGAPHSPLKIIRRRDFEAEGIKVEDPEAFL